MRRPQFTLRDAVGFLSLLGLFLAVVVQFGAFATLFGVYLGGIAIGFYLSSPRIAAASVCGAAVFLFSLLATWRIAGTPAHLYSREYVNVHNNLDASAAAVLRFHAQNGRFPLSPRELPELPEDWRKLTLCRSAELRTTDRGVELCYLGMDQKVGGEGVDADLTLQNFDRVTQTPIPFRKFLDWEDIVTVQVCVILGSLIAACSGILVSGFNRAGFVVVCLIVSILTTATAWLASTMVAFWQSGL